MTALSIEMVQPDKLTALWPTLKPLFQAACEGNEIAKDELTAEDIYLMGMTGMAAVMVMYEGDEVGVVLVIQFNDTGDKRGADIVAMAGRNLMRFKVAYWEHILDWLRANGVKFLDAHTSARQARIYMRKFGFTKSCTYVRKPL